MTHVMLARQAVLARQAIWHVYYMLYCICYPIISYILSVHTNTHAPYGMCVCVYVCMCVCVYVFVVHVCSLYMLSCYINQSIKVYSQP